MSIWPKSTRMLILSRACVSSQLFFQTGNHRLSNCLIVFFLIVFCPIELLVCSIASGLPGGLSTKRCGV